MKILVGSDHAGLELKLKVIHSLPEFEWEDLGTLSNESTDYPDYANKVCQRISEIEDQNIRAKFMDAKDGQTFGLLICGSGQGMAMRANKFPLVRAALVWSEEITKLSRQHNNANILCLGSRFTLVEDALKYIRLFTTTSFEGGRHQGRVEKLSADTRC